MGSAAAGTGAGTTGTLARGGTAAGRVFGTGPCLFFGRARSGGMGRDLFGQPAAAAVGADRGFLGRDEEQFHFFMAILAAKVVKGHVFLLKGLQRNEAL